MTSIRNLILVLVATLAAVGCGGGGGSTGGSGGTRLATFITDSMDDNDHVWVTVHRLELVKVSGGSEVIFDDPTGQIVDLKTLRDSTGERFNLLGVDSVPRGPYSGAKVTLAKSLTIFGAGATTGTAMTFANSFDDGAGKSSFTFNFSSPKNFEAGDDDIVIDFDLQNWNAVANVVTPAFREGSESGLNDPDRHEDDDYKGFISGLSGTSPNFTFTLTQGNRSLTVKTSADTDIFENDGEGNPQLANGKRVEVRGVFSTSDNVLLASAVKIKDSDDDDEDEDEVKGESDEANSTNGTFMVSAREVEGFVPTEDWVNVVTNDTTKFFSDGGRVLTYEEFFSAISSSTEVEVEGTYDAATNTITARKAKLEDEDEDEDEAEAGGAPSAINVTAGTFSVTLSEWSGFSASAGQVLAVTTTLSTVYKDDNGETMTKEAFFTALASSPLVEVEGHYTGGALVAKKVKLDDD